VPIVGAGSFLDDIPEPVKQFAMDKSKELWDSGKIQDAASGLLSKMQLAVTGASKQKKVTPAPVPASPVTQVGASSLTTMSAAPLTTMGATKTESVNGGSNQLSKDSRKLLNQLLGSGLHLDKSKKREHTKIDCGCSDLVTINRSRLGSRL